ncbi:hypothetical protein [Streptomyces gilvifuscus]|uniref:Uncharacterized protein n=1 Tax=Streptomyces gilvifuscus TaxID=1550617 RepID=A0ABT5G3A4_9ACTN|nr:hypothetical protein [Streptomyces gilvifuscus]MDC2959273.1 hypothetical protein [Streptomyces gilvifuscus]
MLLFAVNSKDGVRHLDSPLLSGEDVARLLELRAIADGTPVYLYKKSMMTVEPLRTWGRGLTYADLAESTLEDYGRIMARFSGHQENRGRDLLTVTESDQVAYKRTRTQLQERPIGASAWGKESGSSTGSSSSPSRRGTCRTRRPGARCEAATLPRPGCGPGWTSGI